MFQRRLGLPVFFAASDPDAHNPFLASGADYVNSRRLINQAHEGGDHEEGPGTDDRAGPHFLSSPPPGRVWGHYFFIARPARLMHVHICVCR